MLFLNGYCLSVIKLYSLPVLSPASTLSYYVAMGGAVGKDDSVSVTVPETKLEAKILEAMQQRETEGTSMKSFNSIILKFPKIDASLRKCKAIFQEFGEC